MQLTQRSRDRVWTIVSASFQYPISYLGFWALAPIWVDFPLSWLRIVFCAQHLQTALGYRLESASSLSTLPMQSTSVVPWVYTKHACTFLIGGPLSCKVQGLFHFLASFSKALAVVHRFVANAPREWLGDGLANFLFFLFINCFKQIFLSLSKATMMAWTCIMPRTTRATTCMTGAFYFWEDTIACDIFRGIYFRGGYNRVLLD